MNEFDYNSLRARYARLGQLFKSPIILLLIWLSLFASLFTGLTLLILHSSLGWLCFIPAIFCLIFLTIIELLLSRVPLGPTENITDILSSNAISLMDQNPTPNELAPKLIKTRSGRFLALRFGIGPKLLSAIAAELPQDMQPVFENARKIKTEINATQISGGILAVALIMTHENHEAILGQLRLSLADLKEGIAWYNYLHGLVKDSKKKRRDGGIARDFTFGFTPMLSRFGQNLSALRSQTTKTQLFRASHLEAIQQMTEIFSSQGRQNVALIGPVGSGRSAIINAFAEQLLDANSKIPSTLKYRQIFKLDAAALISATDGQGDIERLITSLMNEAYSAKNIILYLENAQLFFETGVGSIDISKLLLPVLQAGRLRIILSLDEQKFLELSATNPAFSTALNKIMVSASNEAETMKVLEDQVPYLEWRYHVTYTYWALKEAYRLGNRYIKKLEMPGRAMYLLENAARYAKDGLVFGESVAEAIEKTQGIKLQSAVSTLESRNRLLNLETLIHQRMIGQTQAVRAIADALRRAATGVRNEKKPIGTYLFLGPTGVGKTELAKVLSEVYFNGESEIIRIDLNEYVEASDVNRLIAEAATDPMSLTAQVEKHPFSVVLLDEIEKASPKVLTTLLQLLDEGVLRDSKNQEISFRDTIIICTSNAGADLIRSRIEAENYESLKTEIVNFLIESREFKPEFLNRFDEICLFKPLSKTELLQIVELILNNINQTLAPQKIKIHLSDLAKTRLIDAGYDPAFGARPLKRVVSKTVENIIAKANLSGEIQSGDTLEITEAQIEAELGQ